MYVYCTTCATLKLRFRLGLEVIQISARAMMTDIPLSQLQPQSVSRCMCAGIAGELQAGLSFKLAGQLDSLTPALVSSSRRGCAKHSMRETQQRATVHTATAPAGFHFQRTKIAIKFTD